MKETEKWNEEECVYAGVNDWKSACVNQIRFRMEETFQRRKRSERVNYC